MEEPSPFVPDNETQEPIPSWPSPMTVRIVTPWDSVYDVQDIDRNALRSLESAHVLMERPEAASAFKDYVRTQCEKQLPGWSASPIPSATPANRALVMIHIWNPVTDLFAEAKAILSALLGVLLENDDSMWRVEVQIEDGYPDTPVRKHVAVVRIYDIGGWWTLHLNCPGKKHWLPQHAVSEPWVLDQCQALVEDCRAMPPVDAPEYPVSMEVRLSSSCHPKDMVGACWLYAWAFGSAGRLKSTPLALTVHFDESGTSRDVTTVALAWNRRTTGMLDDD